MSHQIDWTNERGARAVEAKYGTRRAAAMPITGPIVYNVMDSIGQFQLATIAREMRQHGWEMRPHSHAIIDARATIAFVNASPQSGKFIEQLRTAHANQFYWRVRDCGLIQKELFWQAAALHAARSVPLRSRRAITFPVIIESIDNEPLPGDGQSVELDFDL